MDEPTWGPLLDDYIATHQLSVETGDVDVPAAMIKNMAHILNLDVNHTAWLTLLVLAYDHIGSALLAYAATDGQPQPLSTYARFLPVGTNRRMHARPAVLAQHLSAIVPRCDSYQGAANWLAHIATAGEDQHGRRRLDYRAALAGLMRVHGIGAWGAYRICTLAATVLSDYDPMWAALAPTDMCVSHTDAVDAPLAMLTQEPDGALGRRRISNADITRYLGRVRHAAHRLVATLTDAGFNTTPAACKTTLVQFRQMYQGRYYIGHDIDTGAAQLAAADRTLRRWEGALPTGNAAVIERGHRLLEAAWNARSLAFGLPYLGERELPPRLCVDRARKRVYRDTGKIPVRDPSSLRHIVNQITDELTDTVLRPALAAAGITDPDPYWLEYEPTPIRRGLPHLIYQTTTSSDFKIDAPAKDIP